MWNYMFSFLGGMDWVTVFAFFVVATFAFLAPRLGYTAKPDLFMSTLHLFVAVIVLNFIIVYFMPDRDSFEGYNVPPMITVLMWAKGGLQVFALLLLIRDLRSLQPANAQERTGTDVSPSTSAGQNADGANEPAADNP